MCGTLSNHDVFWFDIAVDEAQVVEEGDCLADGQQHLMGGTEPAAQGVSRVGRKYSMIGGRESDGEKKVPPEGVGCGMSRRAHCSWAVW